jgi:hypothetical protein
MKMLVTATNWEYGSVTINYWFEVKSHQYVEVDGIPTDKEEEAIMNKVEELITVNEDYLKRSCIAARELTVVGDVE